MEANWRWWGKFFGFGLELVEFFGPEVGKLGEPRRQSATTVTPGRSHHPASITTETLNPDYIIIVMITVTKEFGVK